jgi:hypothetical protein
MMKEQLTHKEICLRLAESAREKMCRSLGITSDQYDMLHYELAHQWLEHNNYVELTARVFILSRSFHSWFRQQAVFTEMNLLRQTGSNDHRFPELHRETIINMPFRPSGPLRTVFTEEGFEAIRRDNELRKIRIYG